MKKIFLILLGIVTFGGFANAIESDFKNSLLKVDYVKTSNDSYNIRLFTQKPYSEPIKVIKKTNTNYYILLPETFHSVSSVAPTGDIKSTEVKLFPYAGQDLNNGYTKISIYTTKPLNIKAQLNSSTGAVAPSINAKELAKLDSAFNQNNAQEAAKIQAQREAQLKAQREAAARQQQEAQRQAQLKAQREAAAQQQAAQQAKQEAQRQAQLKAQREAQLKAQREAAARQQQEAQRQAQLRQQEAQRQAQLKAQREAQLKAQREAAAQQQAAQQAKQEAQRQATVQQNNQAQNSNKLQVSNEAGQAYNKIHGADFDKEKKSEAESSIKTPENSTAENENKGEFPALEENNIITEDIENASAQGQISDNPDKNENKASIKEIIKDKFRPFVSHLRPYYYIIKDNIILFGALIIALGGILLLSVNFIATKNKKKGTAKSMESEQTLADTTENLDLEALKNDINSNYEHEQNAAAADEIQSFKDEFKNLAYDIEQQDSAVGTLEASEEIQEEEPPEEEYIEPEILSSVEIAPKRGFMVIDRQGVKALFGYIKDEVFLLYQFKEFLSNYEIKFRISEKQDNKAFFIVKIDKFKLLIRVTGSAMRLELEM